MSEAVTTTTSPTAALTSGCPQVDGFLRAGLPFGSICEWGVPMGRGGREVVLAFIGAATRGVNLFTPQLVLWVTAVPASDLSLYPPTWNAHGVILDNVRFVTSTQPVRDLRPVFLDALFRVIVLDAPQRLTRDDVTFIAHQARRRGYLVMILRNYVLSNELGNIWTKLRLNCWRDEKNSAQHYLQIIRGLAPGELTFSLTDGGHGEGIRP